MRLARPSFPDLLFAVLLAIVCARGNGLESLLADGDTGWHIRTGEWIVKMGRVPQRDLFSFSRPGAPWTAWEWLADVLFARLFAWRGLAAVAAACAVVLCLAAAVLCCWLLERGVGLWLATATTLVCASASTIHFLARPHVFTLLFFTIGLWALDRDRRGHTLAIWGMLPLTAVWCNMHGGFTVWLAALWLLVLVCALEKNVNARRYLWLAFGCSLATLANPYGWNLHRHITEYLASSWILNHVQEFQPPQIRSENMVVFAALLVAGVALAARSAVSGRRFDALLVWGLALAALRSARHVPLFATAAAPVIAENLASGCGQNVLLHSRRAVRRILWDIGLQLGRARGITAWSAAFAAFVFWAAWPAITDFPASTFPSRAVTGNLAVFTRGVPRPILTSDQWGDYLVFRLYPRVRVFFDGRSDFYGEKLGDDYAALMQASERAPDLLDRYGFDVALLPHDWPLERLMAEDPAWQPIYRDSVASMFLRTQGTARKCSPPPGGPPTERVALTSTQLKETPATAELSGRN